MIYIYISCISGTRTKYYHNETKEYFRKVNDNTLFLILQHKHVQSFLYKPQLD